MEEGGNTGICDVVYFKEKTTNRDIQTGGHDPGVVGNSALQNDGAFDLVAKMGAGGSVPSFADLSGGEQRVYGEVGKYLFKDLSQNKCQIFVQIFVQKFVPLT